VTDLLKSSVKPWLYYIGVLASIVQLVALDAPLWLRLSIIGVVLQAGVLIVAYLVGVRKASQKARDSQATHGIATADPSLVDQVTPSATHPDARNLAIRARRMRAGLDEPLNRGGTEKISDGTYRDVRALLRRAIEVMPDDAQIQDLMSSWNSYYPKTVRDAASVVEQIAAATVEHDGDDSLVDEVQ
jgi:hypothetical protein